MPPKTKKYKYRDECIEAYKRFNTKPEVGGLKIKHIPKLPRYTEVDNYGLKRNERKFKYFEMPKPDFETDEGGNIISSSFEGLSEEEEKELLIKIWDYLQNGYFFYNGDELEYITGDHWYFLNVIKLDVVKEVGGEYIRTTDHPYYIDAHRDVFYFWKQVEIEPRCFGMLLITRRRFAKTSIALSICLHAATARKKAKIGLQAQTGDVANDNFDKIVELWSDLPRHPMFFPTHAGSDNPAKKLEFRNPTKRSTKSQHIKSEKVLNSWIGFKSTKTNAYDGAGLHRYYLDEASKIEECNLNELYDIVRESMAHGSLALGKMLITSTAENIGGKTLGQFEELWSNSDIAQRETNDMRITSSGLYRLFIPADVGYSHDAEEDGDLPDELNISTIDEFGNSNREVARKVIMGMRKLKTGDQLIRYIRKYPLTIHEAFAVEKGASPFNTLNLNQQLTYNRDIEANPRRGNFEWVGRDVFFYPHERGRWVLSWMPPEDYRCRLSKGFEGLSPTVRECWTGIDPYEADKTVEKGSDAAAVTWLNIGQFTDRIKPVCIYLNRPPTAEEMFDDLLKQCVFFSSKALVEVNAGRGLVRHWKQKGYKGLLLPDPLYPLKHQDGCHTKNEDTRNTMVNKQRTYIEENVGLLDLENLEYADIQFQPLLEDWRGFEAGNWTPYDLTVASMLGLHAIPTKKVVQRKWNLNDIIGEYDNSGVTSKLKK